MTTPGPTSSPARRARSPWLEAWQWQLLVLSTLIKLLLLPTYHSTDFEVHRNWLAITRTLPLSQWYFDETSKWTLDYPPFFAYLSWLLAIPAARWDPRIVDLHAGLEYDAWPCKVFMRVSVIVTELTFATALFALSRPSLSSSSSSSSHQLPPWCVAALLLHPGLLIIDHIHFQYNGFLYGILLWSIWAARQRRPLLCAFLFSTLLNFKHIYVYVAPAFFVYLLQSYVIRGGTTEDDDKAGRKKTKGTSAHVGTSGVGERLFTLAVITLLPFVASLLPLALSGLSSNAPAGPIGIVQQMLRRMFPFSRGLNHAYWAANVWALYTFADRALVKLLGLTSGQGNVTRGILGDTYFDVLPQITAGHCFLLTLLVTLVLCTRLWTRPLYGTFVESIGLFGLTSFLFGFHVHEKAILIALLPLTVLSGCSYTMLRKTFVLSVAGTVGLFPLLFEAREVPIKIVYTLLWLMSTPFASTLGILRVFGVSSNGGGFGHQTPSNWDLLVHFAEDIYVSGFIVLVAFTEIVHPAVFGRGPFSLHGQPTQSAAQQLSESSAAVAATLSQNPLLSYASVAAQSAVEALSQAVNPAASTPSSSAAAAESIASVASHASSLAASLLQSAAAVASDAAAPPAGAAQQVAASAASIANAAASAVIAQPASAASSLADTAVAAVAALPNDSTTAGTLEFLPLMLTSVYCAIGVAWVWFSLSARFLRGTDDAGDGVAPAAKRKPVKTAATKSANGDGGDGSITRKSNH